MADQKQHSLSQVYLKQFAYKDNGNRWKVSIYSLGNPITDNKFIKSFTAETNIFDITLFGNEAPEVRRHFENKSSVIETYYPSVIRKIEKKGELDEVSRGVLVNYVSNILCRTEKFRHLLELFLQPETRENFFEEISMFSKGDQDLEFLKAINPAFPINKQINLIIGNVMNHLVRIFDSFNMVIVKDFDDRGWFSTDNPVTLDLNNEFDFIIPVKTEVYFPLSKEYCLFMYHPNVMTNNELRKYQHGEIIQATEEMHKWILDKITSNANKFLIFPIELEKTDLREEA